MVSSIEKSRRPRTKEALAAPRHAPSKKETLDVKKLVWVTVGKTDHQAWLLEELRDQETVLIRWDTTGDVERVSVISVRHEIPSRRSRTATHVFTYEVRAKGPAKKKSETKSSRRSSKKEVPRSQSQSKSKSRSSRSLTRIRPVVRKPQNEFIKEIVTNEQSLLNSKKRKASSHRSLSMGGKNAVPDFEPEKRASTGAPKREQLVSHSKPRKEDSSEDESRNHRSKRTKRESQTKRDEAEARKKVVVEHVHKFTLADCTANIATSVSLKPAKAAPADNDVTMQPATAKPADKDVSMQPAIATQAEKTAASVTPAEKDTAMQTASDAPAEKNVPLSATEIAPAEKAVSVPAERAAPADKDFSLPAPKSIPADKDVVLPAAKPIPTNKDVALPPAKLIPDDNYLSAPFVKPISTGKHVSASAAKPITTGKHVSLPAAKTAPANADATMQPVLAATAENDVSVSLQAERLTPSVKTVSLPSAPSQKGVSLAAAKATPVASESVPVQTTEATPTDRTVGSDCNQDETGAQAANLPQNLKLSPKGGLEVKLTKNQRRVFEELRTGIEYADSEFSADERDSSDDEAEIRRTQARLSKRLLDTKARNSANVNRISASSMGTSDCSSGEEGARLKMNFPTTTHQSLRWRRTSSDLGHQ